MPEQNNNELRKKFVEIADGLVAEYTKSVRQFLDSRTDFRAYPAGDFYHQIVRAFAEVPSVTLRKNRYTEIAQDKLVALGLSDDMAAQILSEEIRNLYFLPLLQTIENAAKNVLQERVVKLYVENCCVDYPFGAVSKATADKLFAKAYRFAIDCQERETGEFTNAPSQKIFDAAVRLMDEAINEVVY